MVAKNFNWQGHRGCRGIMPENSIEGFIHALHFPVKTLELDVVLSKDFTVVVSHEPWFSDEICNCVGLKEKNLFRLTYEEIKAIPCGLKFTHRFPEQQKLRVFKPSLKEVVEAVKKHCESTGLPLPLFNIELKSKPEWDNIYIPNTDTFVQTVHQTIVSLGIGNLTTIQSFDQRILNAFQSMNTNVQIAFLTESPEDPLLQLQVLKHLPEIYSPYYKTVVSKDVYNLHKLGVKVIPWTVNDTASMHALIDLGVDGIITDYPNLIKEIDR